MEKQLIPPKAFPLDLAPGIRMLGNYYFNLFLVVGTHKSALFETGVSGVADLVGAQLARLGMAPDYLIVSHPHADHITGLPGLREQFPHARVLAGQGAAAFAAHPRAVAAMTAEDAHISAGLADRGLAPGRPSLDRALDLTGLEEVDQVLDLDLGGGTVLTLMPVPGHSPGNLIAWEKRTRVLFCSDSLGFHYPGRGFWPLFFTGAGPYLSTLDLMAGLDPGIICPAHQGPIRDVKPSLDLARKTTLDLIARAARHNGDDEALAQALFKESFRDEFTLYTPTNILNCNRLLIRRAREIDND